MADTKRTEEINKNRKFEYDRLLTGRTEVETTAQIVGALGTSIVLEKSGTQNVLTGAEDPVEYDIKIADPLNEFNTSTFQFIPKNDGIYLIVGHCTIGAETFTNGEQSNFSVHIGGTRDTYLRQWVSEGTTTQVKQLHGSVILQLSENDVLTFKLFQNSGQTVAIQATGVNGLTQLGIYRLS